MEKDAHARLRLENDINNEGYNCIYRNNLKMAIAYLKVNTILFPETANTWDSLGEAYFINRQYNLCIEAMKRSLKLNPNNQNALNFIKDSAM